MTTSGPPFVVAIGGFDPSCGAGVVADARSIEAMGALPLSVVTAITVQSGKGLRQSHAVPAARVLAQLDELLSSLPVAAIKIGQVPTTAVARALVERLGGLRVPVVLDPVLVASGGGALAGGQVASVLFSSLVPRAALVTVNLSEATAFCGRPVDSLDAMREAAAEIEGCGATAVLVKGGHLRGDPVDVLREKGRDRLLRARRLRGGMHGTGCALASAAAARLAQGNSVRIAVRDARRHVRGLLSRAVRRGGRSLRAPVTPAPAH